jgi:hyperosmotically inducible periplasmic protein
MKSSLVCFVALLAGGPLASAAPAAPVAQVKTPAASDTAVTGRIQKRFASDPALRKYNIKVNVDEGVAILSGTVATDADRTQASELAKVPGVTRVDNRIVVDLDAATSHGLKGTAGKIGEKTKEGTEKAYDKTKEGAEKAYDKTKEGASKAGEEITDTWITTRVKSKFVGEDLLKDSDIHVTTDNHVVTLTGTAMTRAGRARAVAEAKSVDGVKRVVDKIRIGPAK